MIAGPKTTQGFVTNKVQYKAAVTTLAVLFLTKAVESQSKEVLTDENLNAQIATRCDEAAYLAARAHAFQGELKSQQGVTAENQRTAALWELESLKTTGNRRTAFQALAAYGNALVRQQASSTAETRTTLATSLMILNRRIGAQAAINVIDSTTFSDTGALTPTTHQTDGNPLATTVTLTITPNSDCTLKEVGEIGDSGHTIGQPTGKKISIFADSAMKPATKLQGQVQFTCSGGTTPQWQSNAQLRGCSTTNNPGEIKLALSKAKLFATATPTAKFSTTDNSQTGGCGKQKDVEKQLVPLEAAVKYAKPLEKLAELKLTELQNKPMLVAAIRELTGGAKLQGSTLTTTLNKLFGSDQATFQKDFITAIGSKQTKHRDGDELKDAELQTLIAGEAYTSAIGYLHHQNAKANAAKESTAQSPHVPAAECKDKPKDDCDPTKCEWKGSEDKGKCETKGGKEGPKAEENKEEKCKDRNRMQRFQFSFQKKFSLISYSIGSLVAF
ncbi:uncharacterized protein TEOVI_000330300 [Trypanosoma equiperdum]|uniref:Variant surface glycoprotein (VSG) n=1 Tax=Trypanosoma equiperdum TaxID=5694 RepID=A0A1G4IH24_TRYEQ|nr:hypothetical protein, conserved [Trypanosoma equiperdum]